MTTRNTPSKNLLPKGQHDRNSAQVSAYDDNASEAGGPNSSGFSYLSENGLKNSTEERCEHVLSVTNVNVLHVFSSRSLKPVKANAFIL